MFITKPDSSTKILGFKYQEMVALLKCLDAKEHTKIYLECFGDVSDGNTSVEVKHSTDEEKTLYNTHIDFWKTLGNIIEDKNLYQDYTHFILHTTAKIKEYSIFEGWNKLMAFEKKQRIFSVSPNNTIRPYYTKVQSCKSEELENILNRFTIKDGQDVAKTFYVEQLLNHISIVNATEEKNREAIVERLLGYISALLLTSESISYKWEVDIDNFKTIFRAELKNYQIEDLIFPIIKVNEEEKINKEFRFIKELKEIEYDTKIGLAMDDYLKSNKSRLKMIKQRINLSELLDEFDGDIREYFLDVKSTHNNMLRNQNNFCIKEKSRRFYDECLRELKGKNDIIGIKGVKEFYPKGRAHYNIEVDDNLKWMLENNES